MAGGKNKKDGKTNTGFGCFTHLREASHELHQEGVGCARFRALRCPHLRCPHLSPNTSVFSSTSGKRADLPELWKLWPLTPRHLLLTEFREKEKKIPGPDKSSKLILPNLNSSFRSVPFLHIWVVFWTCIIFSSPRFNMGLGLDIQNSSTLQSTLNGT